MNITVSTQELTDYKELLQQWAKRRAEYIYEQKATPRVAGVDKDLKTVVSEFDAANPAPRLVNI